MNLNRDCLYSIFDEIYDLEPIYKTNKSFKCLTGKLSRLVECVRRNTKKIIDDCRNTLMYYSRKGMEVYISPNRTRLCIIHYDDYVSLYADFYDISNPKEIYGIEINKKDRDTGYPYDLMHCSYDGCISFPDCEWITDDIFLWGEIREWDFTHHMDPYNVFEQGLEPEMSELHWDDKKLTFWGEARLLSIQHYIYDKEQHKMSQKIIEDYSDKEVRFIPKDLSRANRKQFNLGIKTLIFT